MQTILCVGHAVQDFVFAVDRLPEHAEKYSARSLALVGGGPAATAAVAIVRLGGRALLAARLGQDTAGKVAADELASYGVDCRYLRHFDHAGSSISAVMVDPSGERMIVNHTDQRMPAAADWLPEAAATGAAAVLADTRWPEGAARALQSARSAGLPAVLDADRPVPGDGDLLKLATHVAFSVDGLADLSGHRDPVRGLEEIGRRVPGWCCVTAGARGVFVRCAEKIVLHAGFAVPVVDTLGAGDVWHGAFILALAEGAGEDAAVRFASAAAALKVQRHGGRAAVPTRAEVESFLALDGYRQNSR